MAARDRDETETRRERKFSVACLLRHDRRARAKPRGLKAPNVPSSCPRRPTFAALGVFILSPLPPQHPTCSFPGRLSAYPTASPPPPSLIWRYSTFYNSPCAPMSKPPPPHVLHLVFSPGQHPHSLRVGVSISALRHSITPSFTVPDTSREVASGSHS